MVIHNAFITECHEREGANRPGKYELAKGMIGNSCN